MASSSYWRERARTVIQGVLEEHGGKSYQEVMAAVDRAYPFGPRKHHPYKIWLDERRKLTRELVKAGAASPLAIDCKACGVAAGRPCRDIEGGGKLTDQHGVEAFHDARDKRSSGPLFDGVQGPGREPGPGSARGA
jgi:hypothetical protein